MAGKKRCYVCNKTIDECVDSLRENIIENYDEIMESVGNDYFYNIRDLIDEHKKTYYSDTSWHDSSVIREELANEICNYLQHTIEITTIRTRQNIPISVCNICEDICSKITHAVAGKYY